MMQDLTTRERDVLLEALRCSVDHDWWDEDGDWQTARSLMQRLQSRRCVGCGATLTVFNVRRAGSDHKHVGYCDTCDTTLWDNSAWLTARHSGR